MRRLQAYHPWLHPGLASAARVPVRGHLPAGDRGYWEALDTRLAEFARSWGLRYVRDDDSFEQPFDAPPTVVNFFYHEEVKKSAKRASGKAAEKAGEGFAG